MMAERVKVLRHSRFFRLNHWLIVILTAIMWLSGFQMSGLLGNLGLLGPILESRGVHFFVGMMWLPSFIIYIYYLIVSGEMRWYIRVIKGTKFLWSEIRAWFRGPKIEEPIAYDAEKKEYVEKIVPTEALAFSGFVLFVALSSITGVLMAFPDVFTFVVVPMSTAILVRSLHLIGAVSLLVLVTVHIYSVFVFRMVRSNIFGDREEPVLRVKSQKA